MYSALPKVLHPLAGVPMLARVLDCARSLEPAKLVVVHGHGGELVQARLAANDIEWVRQAKQLGTGHAVQQALPCLNQDDPRTLVLYGDVPLIQPQTLTRLSALADNANHMDDALALLTFTLDNPEGYGRIVRDCNGEVSAIVEQKDATPAQLSINEVNTGIMVTPTARLSGWLSQLGNQNAQGEYYLTDVIGLAVAEGVSIHTMQPKFGLEIEGINNQQQLASLERAWQQHLVEQLMLQGVRLADPARVDVRGDLRCGRDVFIDIGCVFLGEVELADNVEIGPYCVLHDVRVGAGARILAFSHVHASELASDVIVGPYARLRPGTTLESGAHIGNFVEVKASRIGKGSKANHLAYLGDSEIGDRVNIGAGTITCNYDGANKHLTIIGDDAFIGSDTQLVAPVQVGEGATLGAGTTLTRDAPPHSLTVSRTRQSSLPDWQRPKKRPSTPNK